MSEYKEVLYKWAQEKLKTYYGLDGRKVERVEHVDFYYDEGYAYSSVTFEDPSFKVVVSFYYEGVSTRQTVYLLDEQCESMGTLLTELFAIAERES